MNTNARPEITGRKIGPSSGPPSESGQPPLDPRRREAHPEVITIGDEVFDRNDISAERYSESERSHNRRDREGAPYLMIAGIKYRPRGRLATHVLRSYPNTQAAATSEASGVAAIKRKASAASPVRAFLLSADAAGVGERSSNMSPLAKKVVRRQPSSRLPKPSQWTSRIAAAWQRGVESILETGRLLIEAKTSLDHGEFQRMIESDLPFGCSTAQKLMVIARHPVLSNAAHVRHLPPAWGTLHELSKLPVAYLRDKLDAGVIKSDTERDVVIGLAHSIQREKWEAEASAKARHLVVERSDLPERQVVLHIASSPYPNRSDDPCPDTSEPSGEVPAGLKEIAAQASEISEPSVQVDRYEILLAAWQAAGEAERRQFLRHIGARLTAEAS